MSSRSRTIAECVNCVRSSAALWPRCISFPLLSVVFLAQAFPYSYLRFRIWWKVKYYLILVWWHLAYLSLFPTLSQMSNLKNQARLKVLKVRNDMITVRDCSTTFVVLDVISAIVVLGFVEWGSYQTHRRYQGLSPVLWAVGGPSAPGETYRMALLLWLAYYWF